MLVFPLVAPLLQAKAIKYKIRARIVAADASLLFWASIQYFTNAQSKLFFSNFTF